MTVELLPAGPSDEPDIRTLLDPYLAELSRYREIAVGAADAGSYPWLESYWTEPGRHAFLIRSAAVTAGFAFVRTPPSTGSDVSQIAEFYVAPSHRQGGVGRAAAQKNFRRFPGPWQLQVHAANAAARAFWRAAVGEAAAAPPPMSELRAPDGRRLQFDFWIP